MIIVQLKKNFTLSSTGITVFTFKFIWFGVISYVLQLHSPNPVSPLNMCILLCVFSEGDFSQECIIPIVSVVWYTIQLHVLICMTDLVTVYM